jgi:adhesin/invasin
MTSRRLCIVVATAIILACTTDTTVGPEQVVSLAVSPESTTIAVGQLVRLQSVATDASGIQYIGTPTDWTAANTAIATVSSSGEVTGVAPGTTAITATAGGKTATAQVTVTPPPLIVTSADTVSFSAIANGPTPSPQTVIVTNGSSGVLDNISDTITYDPGATGWLTVAHRSPSAPDTIDLTDGSTAFAPGTYIARVSLRAPQASNSPDTVIARLVLGVGAPTQIAADSGLGQSAAVNTTVAVAPAVIVRDQYGNAVPGVPVTFAVVSAKGSVTGAVDTTDANGRARVGSWRLGTATGVDSLTATASPLPGSPVTFTATAIAGAPSQLVKTGGDGQVATVNTTVATAPAVRVEDQFGNPVSGASVSFVPTAGSGSVTGGVVAADASGDAVVGSWTLGTGARTDTLVATAGAVNVRFTATATADAASQIQSNAGNGQSATVNTAVATAPRVKVSDQFGNAVPGVAVTFTVVTGGGSISGPVATSDAAGLAAVGSWTLGTSAGSNSLNASAGSLSGSPVTFTATGTAGPATSLATSAGDGQSAAVGTSVATPPTVLVTDAFSNPVSGVQVTFSVTAGNGSLTGPVSTTGAAGTAAVGSWTLGATAKVDTLTASVTGLPSVQFTASATAGSATTLTRISAAARSDSIGGSFTDTVMVTDGSGNAVAGVAVTWAIGGSGTLTPGSPTTDANGIATATRTLGAAAGAVTDTAKATGLTGSPVLFTVTTTSGNATTLAPSAGNNQTDTVGHTLAVAYAVLATDRAANPVQNVSVAWAVSGGGSVSAPSTTTGVNGITSVTRTLGPTAGPQGAIATAAGLTGSPVTFTATATNDMPTSVAVSAGNNQSATVGTAVPTPPGVVVTDQFTNPVAGVIVTFATSARSGTITKPVDTTDASGFAAVGNWTLGSTAGPDTLTATTSPALTGSPVQFLATGISGSATTMALSAGDNQTDTVRATLATQYAVLVTDGSSNPVQGVTVSWAVTKGGGSLTATSQTDASGIARATRVLGDTAGTQTATGSVGGLTGSPVTFNATANPGQPAQLAKQAGDGQNATVNTTVAVAPSVSLKDAYGNALSGVNVTFTITSGGGAINGGAVPVIVATNGSGIAALASWRLGTAAGSNSLSVSSGTLTPVNFSATGTADAPAAIAKSAGDAQSATVGTAVSTNPQVLVSDQFGNPVASATVTFAVTSGGGQVNGGTSAPVGTDALGHASVTWTLGTTAGSNGISATVGAVSPVSFSATGTTAAAQTIAAAGGGGQTDTIGATLATPYTVLVTDQFANAVSGVNVTFTITAGGGAIDGGAGPVIKATDGAGHASVSRTLGTIAGTQTVQASASVPSGSPVTFSATANPGNATTITANSSTLLSGTVNTAVAPAPSVKVTDRGGNAVSGVSVSFAPTSGASGSVTGGSQSTGGTGVATVTSWTLDQTVGNDTVLATSSGLTGSPVRFVATSSPGAVSLTVSTISASASPIIACSTSCTTGGGTASTITATIKDQFGNVISGKTVTLSSTGANNVFTPSPSGTTSAGGVFSATFSSTTAQGKTISAAVTGSGTLTPTASVTVNPGSVSLSVSTFTASDNSITACSVSCTTGGNTASLLTATVTDQFGNVISGATVTPSCSVGTSCTFSPTSGTTNGSGVFTSTFNSTLAQAKTIQGAVTGAGTITQTAAVTVNAAGAASIVVNGGNNQSARAGTAVLTDPSVLVRDAFLNPVPSVTVTFSVSAGGGSLTVPTTPATNASGIATVGGWTLGSTSADAANGTMANTLGASATGAGSTSFSATSFFTLSGDVQPILTGSCALAGCHVSGATAPNLSTGFTFGSTVNVVASCNGGFFRVAPSNATNSVVYRRIFDGGICGFMPPASSGLPAAQQKIIRAWINNGAVNN